MRAAALITMAFGRVLAATGSAEEYVAKVEEAQKLIANAGLFSVEAVLAAVYGHALSQAGHYEQALAANDIAQACVDKIDHRDRQTLGFHPEHWVTTQRCRALVMLGRVSEAEPLIDKLLSGQLGPVDTLHSALALGARIEGAAHAGDGPRAMSLFPLLNKILDGNETPYLLVIRGRFRGAALLASGNAAAAIAELENTLAFAKQHRAGLEMVGHLRGMLEKANLALSERRDHENYSR
jgi:hypothetical protein